MFTFDQDLGNLELTAHSPLTFVFMRSAKSAAASVPQNNNFFDPIDGWIAILVFASLTSLLTFAHAGGIARLFFPAGAFLVGIYLYFKAPILYIGFAWWMWFISPWVRRMVDYYSAFVEPSTVLLAPPLVTVIMGITLLKNLPNLTKEGSTAFLLAILAILYSYFIGIINASAFAATKGLLTWLPPVLFGYHVFSNWRSYPLYRDITQRCFIWGTLILGIYGVIQFTIMPPWDAAWMRGSSPFLNSIGNPLPLQVRVFSLMNGPFSLAVVLLTGLLLLLVNVQPIGIAASIFGYLSFLLSLVRTSWLGWILGLINLFGLLKSSMQMRLIIILLALVLSVIPLTLMEPFSDAISKRVSSLGSGGEDGSVQDRLDGYNRSLDFVLSQGLGLGLGSNDAQLAVNSQVNFKELFGGIGVRDSTILDMVFSMGWVGGIPYLLGFGLLFASMLTSKIFTTDLFAAAARSITIAMLMQFPFGSVFIGISGAIIWVFMALVLAAQRHQSFQLLDAGMRLDLSKNMKSLDSEKPGVTDRSFPPRS